MLSVFYTLTLYITGLRICILTGDLEFCTAFKGMLGTILRE